jgi:two-component system chemotaxis sensor kinase CheA
MSTLAIDSIDLVKACFEWWRDPVYIADRDYNILWANAAYQQMFAYRRRHRKLCHEVAKMTICQTEDCLLSRASATRMATRACEAEMRGAIEPNAACSAVGIPLAHDNEIVAVVGILRDVSVELRLHEKYKGMLQKERDQKEILEQLVKERTYELEAANLALTTTVDDLGRSRRETAHILENILQAIVTVRADLSVGVEHSRHAEEVFGVADLAGRLFHELLLPGREHDAERRSLEEWLKLVFHSPSLDWDMAQTMVQTEVAYTRPDSTERELEISFQRIFEGERLGRLMVIVEDATEKRSLERSLEAKHREIEDNIEQLAELARLDPEIFEAFFEEAIEIIDRAVVTLGELRQSPPSTVELVDKMFRGMHILKGNAMAFGLVRVAAKSHWVEDAFAELRASHSAISAELVGETERKVHELRAYLGRVQTMASKVLHQKSTDRGEVRATRRHTRVDVELEKLDEICAWVREHLGASGAVAELTERIRGLALVPLGRVYRRFPKLVNDLADKLDKNVNEAITEGGEVALASPVFNEVANALVHLIRNAVDHGIESPPERVIAGKPSFGTVSVKSYYNGSSVHIEVRDDGRGMDPEAILAAAVARGLVPEGEVGAQSALELVFRPGFSTAQSITDISGRGVGLDAVKDMIEKVGGTVSLSTKRGEGSVFSIVLPRAVADGR